MTPTNVLAAFTVELPDEVPAPPGYHWLELEANHWLELGTDHYRVLTHCNGRSDVDIAVVALPDGVHVRAWLDYSEDDDGRIYRWEDPGLLDQVSARVRYLAALWARIAAKATWT